MAPRASNCDNINNDANINNNNHYRCTNPGAASATAELPHLIVGAGLLGVDCAAAFQKAGLPYRIYEATDVPGGVWNAEHPSCGWANTSFSRAQSDPVMFSPVGWFLQENHVIQEHDPFHGIHPSQSMNIIREVIEKEGIQIQYNRKIISFATVNNKNTNDKTHNDNINSDKTKSNNQMHTDPDVVHVVWEDTKTGEQHQETFAGVHFRTGKLSQVRPIALPNEATFQAGPIAIGCYNAPEQLSFADKTVIIIGWGSFAVENAATALRQGAAKVHIISRSRKPHLFDYATYAARRFYTVEAGTDPSLIPEIWDKIFDINTTAARACGDHVQDLLLGDDVVAYIDGKRHYYFAEGGLPCVTVDAVALGMHYGLIEYHQGNVVDTTEFGVVLSSGETVKADMIIKCTGFDTDVSFLNHGNKKHYIQDALFVDGCANVTSFHGADGVNQDAFFGPCTPATCSFLLSVYTLHDFNLAIAHFVKHPDTFQAFKQHPMFSSTYWPEKIGFISMLHCFSKLVSFGDEHIMGNFVHSMNQKEAEYAKVLDEQTFLKHDKKHWETWSAFYAEKTGQPLLQYPFANLIKGSSSF